MKDDKPSKKFTKKSANALETMFTPMGSPRKEVRKEQSVRSDIETILSSFIEQGGASYDNVQSMVDAWEKWSKENEVEDSIKQKVLRTLKSMYPSDQ
jgi:hypothetical protein